MSAHTPGPLCDMGLPAELHYRDTRLIAAAPRMLGALKDALITVEARCRLEGIEPDASPTVVMLRDVIAEATNA